MFFKTVFLCVCTGRHSRASHHALSVHQILVGSTTTILAFLQTCELGPCPVLGYNLGRTVVGESCPAPSSRSKNCGPSPEAPDVDHSTRSEVLPMTSDQFQQTLCPKTIPAHSVRSKFGGFGSTTLSCHPVKHKPRGTR